MIYNLYWTVNAKNDLLYWKSKDKNKLQKIKSICGDILSNPTTGLGKPEKLKYFKSNIWSRRITREHRIVYQIDNNKITILQCRYHYEDR